MNFKALLGKFSFVDKDLYYKLSVAFAVFFIVPVVGFLFFAVKYEILNDKYIPFFFLGLLIFFFFGFRLLRKLFDSIRAISTKINKSFKEGNIQQPLIASADEIGNIVQSFRVLEDELKNKFLNLEKKKAELTTLKEHSDLCYMTFNPNDLLYITLERALKLIDADIGSIMILTQPKRDAFIIEANIGLDDIGKKGTIIPFENSLSKYAVINKSPLLVENIETDSRFGRQARVQYSTKSFICMPLKTSFDVIGVLNVSRRKSEMLFSQADVDALTPLMSNAAFTYDNLRLLGEVEKLSKSVRSMGMISKSINSSLRGGELLQSVFQEMKKNIPFDIIALLSLDVSAPMNLFIVDFLASIPTEFSRGYSYIYEETILDKAIKQQRTLFIPDVNELQSSVEKQLFQQEGIQTCLVMPLTVEGKVTSLLLMYNIPRIKGDKLIDIIDVMGDHLSQAIEKDRMIESVIKRNLELESLRLIGSALSSSTFDLDKMLTYTMDMIRGVMNVEAGYILLLEDNELEFAAAFHLDMEKLKRIRLKKGEGIAGYVLDRGVTVLLNDALKNPHFSATVDQETGFHTQSIISVPMISQGHVIGVIEILNKMEGEFNAADEQLLQSIATSVSIALENARLYSETVTMAEKERGIRNVFQKFVPQEVIDKIILGTGKEMPVLEEFKMLTILNIDIREFSVLSRKIGPRKTVDMLNYFFSTMGEIVFKHHGIVDKYLGDGFLALFGAPVSSTFDADNAVMAALEMQKAMVAVNAYCQDKFGETLLMGLGIHTGEVVVGNIGFEKKMDYTVIGDAVNFVFKVQSICKDWPNEILITETTAQAAKSCLDVAKVRICEIKPSFGNLKIYRVLEGNESKKGQA